MAAALVLQNSEGRGGGDGGNLSAAALGLVDGEGLIAAVPGSGASYVQLETASGGIGIGIAACISGKCGSREHSGSHNDSQ